MGRHLQTGLGSSAPTSQKPRDRIEQVDIQQDEK